MPEGIISWHEIAAAMTCVARAQAAREHTDLALKRSQIALERSLKLVHSVRAMGRAGEHTTLKL